MPYKLITQIKIAEKVGISQAHLSRIFAGAFVGSAAARKIGRVIGVDDPRAVAAMSPEDIQRALVAAMQKPPV